MTSYIVVNLGWNKAFLPKRQVTNNRFTMEGTRFVLILSLFHFVVTGGKPWNIIAPVTISISSRSCNISAFPSILVICIERKTIYCLVPPHVLSPVPLCHSDSHHFHITQISAMSSHKRNQLFSIQ